MPSHYLDFLKMISMKTFIKLLEPFTRTSCFGICFQWRIHEYTLKVAIITIESKILMIYIVLLKK